MTFERAVIEHILEKEAPEYKKHLPYLLVDRREQYGRWHCMYISSTQKITLYLIF